MWIEILRKEVAAKGSKQAAHELGVSRTTVDLVLHGKYPASTRRVEKRISAIYGVNGKVSPRNTPAIAARTMAIAKANA